MADKEDDALEPIKNALSAKADERPFCGMVMPISEIDGCNENHWKDVKKIIESCVDAAGFRGALVSDGLDVGIIQKRIVKNLYESPLVVCDVSCRNPNVMFELGLRLAFNLPTVIVKDDITPFSFDTGMIEHIIYPRSMRYYPIEEFKVILTNKIKHTAEAASKGKHSTFLDDLGPIKIARIETVHVSNEQLFQDTVIERLNTMEAALNRRVSHEILGNDVNISVRRKDDYDIEVCVGQRVKKIDVERAYGLLKSEYSFERVTMIQKGPLHYHIAIRLLGTPSKQILISTKQAINEVLVKSIESGVLCNEFTDHENGMH